VYPKEPKKSSECEESKVLSNGYTGFLFSSAIAQMDPPRRTSFCIIRCEESEVWSSLPQLYRSAFGRDPEREDWSVVETAKSGELPTRDHDIYLITGSHHNVEESLPWMQALCSFIREKARPTAASSRMIGCCFGAQIIAHALGGEVARNPSRRFILKLEDLVPTPELVELHCGHLLAAPQPGGSLAGVAAKDPEPGQPLPFLSAPLPPGLPAEPLPEAAPAPSAPPDWTCPAPTGQLRAVASHGFCVLTLPPGAIRLAASVSCPNEIYSVGDRIIGIQCHPEFTLDVVSSILWPVIVEQRRSISAAEAEEARASFKRPTNNGALQAFLRAFCGLPP
jgi:GMP synthase-like glutamine amidotransferase